MKMGFKITRMILAVIGIIYIGMSCSDDLENTTYFVSDELTVAQTIDAYPELSVYADMLRVTGLFSSLHSYGSYTAFVPVNEVLIPYMQERWGVNSIDEVTDPVMIEEMAEIVKFHTMAKSRGTSSFIEGRMTDTTYTGDFLTTSFLLGSGISNVVINREAKLLTYDIRANNGMVHTINNVLTPYSDPVPEVMKKGGKHTIFVEAMEKTGLFETFTQTKTETGGKMNFTICAESDSVFALSGIKSFDDLVNMLEDTLEYTNPLSSTYRFVAYHATNSFMYAADMPDEGFISTVLPKNAWKIIKTLKELKINASDKNPNQWISLVPQFSNLPAKNGVYHTVDTIMDIYVPAAQHVIFDPVSDQPEYQAKLVKSHENVFSTFYQYVRWYPEDDKRYLQQSNKINLNYNVFDLGGAIWYEFDTPILPKGKYELIICANGGNSARGQFQVYWDGEPVGAIYNLTTKGTSIGFPDSAAMEANGWRHGYKWITNKAGDNQYDNPNCMRRVITKELLCPEQSRHILKLVAVKSGGIPLDYIEWIPVNE